MVRLRALATCVALLAPALFAGEAAAENGVKPRIPVTWDRNPACVEFVDRSASTVFTFEYSIFDEDPSPGEVLLPDEVSDSRTHQFFAFSRQGNPQTEFPYNWISAADVMAAVEKNLITETTVGPEETLDTSPRWQQRFVRITPDDARRPISQESIAQPVEWDTADAPAGVYQLWGYTWEPAFNMWSQRVGNVVVVHDGDPSEVGPAAVVTNGELIVYSDEIALIEGCLFAPSGTTVDGYFSETPPNGSGSDWQPAWVPFAQDEEVSGDTFALEFAPGGGHATPTLLVRLVFTDPDGRSYEAHMPDLVNVLPGSAGGCDTDGGGGFVGNPGCGDDSGGETSGSPTAGEDDSGSSSNTTVGESGPGSSSGPSSAGGSGGSGGSGGCSVGERGGLRGGLLLLGLLALRRRRR